VVVVRVCVALLLLIGLSTLTARADDATGVYESTEAALEDFHETTEPESAEQTVQEVLGQFFPEAIEEEEDTYPASEFLEHDFLLRRTGPAKGSYSGRLFTKYSDDKISGVEKWEKELELFLNYKALDSYIRVGDVNAFAQNNDPFRLEKLNVRYKYESGRVTAGSFNALFGRGLALNMFEDRFLEFDNEAEGLKLEQEWGDAEIVALAGTRKERDEPRASTVRGLRVQQPLGESVDVGAHVVHVEFPEDATGATERAFLKYDLAGGDVTIRAGDVRLYAETVRLKREANPLAQNQYDFDGTDGTGTYAVATYSVPGLSFNLEYKNYKGLLHPFAVLPPVRGWPERRQANPNDDRGIGYSINWAPLDDGSSFNFQVGRDNNHEGTLPYRETLFTYTGPTDQRTTYVVELWKTNEFGELRQQDRLTLNHKINNEWTGGTFIERERLDIFGLKSTDWVYEFEVAYMSKFIFVTTYETTSIEGGQTAWKLFEAKYRPDEDQEINVVLGSRREAFVCSGGICRLEPAFDGLRIDYLLRF
jgi:hypothetical protein